MPTCKDGTLCIELFSSIKVGVSLKHAHTFGCPVFVLQNELASGSTIPRWSPRACIGLNLGPSPLHACNVYLVLSLTMGLISPQYHCCFDDFFETCKYGPPDLGLSSTWQQLAGFKTAKGDPILLSNQRLQGQALCNSQPAPQEPSFLQAHAQDDISITLEFFKDGGVS